MLIKIDNLIKIINNELKSDFVRLDSFLLEEYTYRKKMPLILLVKKDLISDYKFLDIILNEDLSLRFNGPEICIKNEFLILCNEIYDFENGLLYEEESLNYLYSYLDYFKNLKSINN